MKNTDTSKASFAEIGFGFLGEYKVAGMGEPWSMKLDETLDALKQAGIGAILTLTETDMYGSKYIAAGFAHRHEPIDDCEPPRTFEAMDRAVEFIDAHLDEKRGVAVHCLEGRGRTGTVLAAWLAKKENLDWRAAIDKVYRLRFQTVITPSQAAFLKEYIEKRKET